MFRSSRFIVNAGYLDTKKIQTAIHEHSATTGSIVFEIGWGQAKRDAGQMRSLGPNADLAEFIAIARLAALVSAAEIIIQKPVVLRVVTGGRRFRTALFTREAEDNAYNETRADYIRRLGFQDKVQLSMIDDYWSEDEIEERASYLSSLETPTGEPQSGVMFALMGIDWYNIFGAPLEPHGLPVDHEFLRIWKSLSLRGQRLIIRNMIGLIANPALDITSVGDIVPPALLRTVSAWALEVSKRSARRYRILAEATRRLPEQLGGQTPPIPITVIEKPKQANIPTVLLLGRRLGRVLPQHIVPLINANGSIDYLPYYLVVDRTRTVEFGDGRGSPFCVTSGPVDCLKDALMRVSIYEDYEL